MSDLSTITNTFSDQLSQQIQPATEMVNSRLERLQELERTRLERTSTQRATPAGDSNIRHTRRDRLIRQATQQRMPDRRNIMSSVQRTPVRSQSFEIQSSAVSDEMSFREMFDHSRQSIFGSRHGGSNENLAFNTTRRQSDTTMAGFRQGNFASTDSGSGSSTPRSSIREQYGPEVLAGAFEEVNASLFGSNSSITREIRSSSMTREAREASSPTPRFSISPSASTLIRSSSLREGRSRFRRRTIQGVDSNVREAIERERRSPLAVNNTVRNSDENIQQSSNFPSSRTQRLNIQSTIPSRSEQVEEKSSNGFSNGVSSSTENGRYTYIGKIELFPEDGLPVLGILEERVRFIDVEGRIRWLDKNHRIIRTYRTSKKIPEILLKSKEDCVPADDEGLVDSMEGDAEFRHKTLREMLFTSSRRSNKFDRSNSSSSDEEIRVCGIYDEIPTFISFYQPPRPRPNLEEYCKSRQTSSLYDEVETENETATENGTVTDELSISVNTAEPRDNSRDGTMYESETLMIHEQMMSPIAESPGFSERNFSTSSDTPVQSSRIEEVSEVPGDINLVMQRIRIMSSDDGEEQVNLDLDEMRMIQKALAENPSPPDSPRELLSPALQSVELTRLPSIPSNDSKGSEIEPNVPDSPSSVTISNQGSESLTHTSARSGLTSVSRRDSDTASLEATSSRSAPVRQSSKDSISSKRLESVPSRDDSQLASTKASSESVITCTANDSVATTSSNVSSRPVPTTINAVFSTRTSVITSHLSPGSPSGASPASPKSSVISSRVQRQSSSDRLESKLQLPTMDFSPIQKSPQKEVFTYPESQDQKGDRKPKSLITSPDKNETSGASAEVSGVEMQRVEKTSNFSAISVEIPADSGASASEPRSGNASRASPDSSGETVTEVFEEFVSTISQEMINNWSPTRPAAFYEKK